MKEEKKYQELRKLGQELHIPIPEAFWTLEVFDKKGKLIQKHRQRSHSWVRNAYNLLFYELAGKALKDSVFGAGHLNIKDTAGNLQYGNLNWSISAHNQDPDGTTGGYRAPSGQDGWSIMVGSGTNTESFEDYILQSKIANGNGAGQLAYTETEPYSATYTAASKVFKNEIARYFNNNSGGGIDVNEVGLAARGSKYLYEYNWLMTRDRLASTVSVPNTGQLKVTYTIQLTYPA
jgi:hypothetical protein